MRFVLFAMLAAGPPNAAWIESIGGESVFDREGKIVEVSLARTWATDKEVARVAEIETLRRLDLSFTYVSDKGIEHLKRLKQLEELTLDTAEFITDAAMSHLRGNRTLRKLVLRGTDVTDVSLPYIAELTELRTLDLSHTMLGDGGLESLPALTKLEELSLGATRISGINLNFLKLLPRLRSLRLDGIQRRNGGLCWTATITDLDLDTIALLGGLEELNLGYGLGLGRTGKPVGGGNCRATGGVHITDHGLAKLTKLKKLRRLDVSGARITPAGLAALKELPVLERLSLWNCRAVDDRAVDTLAAMSALSVLDLSDTAVGDAGLAGLRGLPNLKMLYLTDTKVTALGAETFRKQKPGAFVSWALREAAQ
ncbi:MAG: hypothetical protein SFV51_08555 [Bryobacteraceae bacterium]|nr:hypothetical protein [Bryobacteraceae bacterium]